MSKFYLSLILNIFVISLPFLVHSVKYLTSHSSNWVLYLLHGLLELPRDVTSHCDNPDNICQRSEVLSHLTPVLLRLNMPGRGRRNGLLRRNEQGRQELTRTQLALMSFQDGWVLFGRRRLYRRRRTPRVFAPAVSQESNDNKTIEYTRDHQLICRNCVEGRENRARDVLIAPEEHGIHWPHALAFHLVRYRHTYFRWIPPCRPGRHRAVNSRTRYRCVPCNFSTSSVMTFTEHIMFSPTNHTVGIPDQVDIFQTNRQPRGRQGNAFGNATEDEEEFDFHYNAFA